MSSLPGDAQTNAPAQAQPYGEVFDRGYRHYEGRREGRDHAGRALILYSLKRGFGIKKRWTAKIIPFGLYAISFVPVIIIVGVRSLLGPVAANIPFGYFDLFQGISTIILLFAAVTAPEMLCDDRRERVLQIYFSRAITRGDYLLAKISALGLMVGSIAFLPAFVLFLGNTFQDASPASYLVDHAGDLGRLVLAGALIGLFNTSIALVAPAFVDRKGIASATTVGGVIIVTAITAALFEAISDGWRRYIVLGIPATIPEGINRWIFTPRTPGSSLVTDAGLPGAWYLLSIAVVAALCGVVMYRRYLMED